MMRFAWVSLAVMFLAAPALARPTVVELFTSQGCASCPAAEALVKALAEDPNILPLSFHVHYWDSARWHDRYASEENTERQRDYNDALHVGTLFTPQIIIDGAASAVGSNATQVREAIEEARAHGSEVPVTIRPDDSGKTLTITVGADESLGLSPQTEVYEMHFNKGERVTIGGGENSGQTVESVNNVIEIIPLVLSHTYRLPLSRLSEDGVAVLVQEEGQGRILGAAMYMK